MCGGQNEDIIRNSKSWGHYVTNIIFCITDKVTTILVSFDSEFVKRTTVLYSAWQFLEMMGDQELMSTVDILVKSSHFYGIDLCLYE